jgi:NADH:ubiquinone oxidoreductase subunit C
MPLLHFLTKNSLSQFQQLVEIAVYDRPGKRYRFTILYHLFSLHYGNRITFFVQTDEVTALPSTTVLYSGAG